jgi:hypothetical protein
MTPKDDSPETWPSAIAFGKFLQMEEGPEKDAVAKKHGYIKGDLRGNAAVTALKKLAR